MAKEENQRRINKIMSRLAEFKLKAKLIVSILEHLESTEINPDDEDFVRYWNEIRQLAMEIQLGIPPSTDTE